MTLAFATPEIPTLAVLGTQLRYPINRIFCVGRNYVAHAHEMGNEVERDAPFYFTKGHHSVVTDTDTAPIPQGTTDYHHEVELVVALGTAGHDIPQQTADTHIYGYGLGLDMTRRDLQQKNRKKGLPWDTAKDVEAGAILSPLTTAAEFGRVASQRLTLAKNGVTVQDSTLDLMVWSIPEIIAHLSTLYHLRPGDLIMTGTPAGVAPIEVGDHLHAQMSGCADLTVTFT